MYELGMIVLPPLVGLGVLAGQIVWGVTPGEPAGRARGPAGDSKDWRDWVERGVWRSPPGLPTTVEEGPRPTHYQFAHASLPDLARDGRLERLLDRPDDRWLFAQWASDEVRAGFALRPEGLGHQKLHAGDLRVDVVRLPRPERELEAMFVGFADDAGRLRVFTLEHPARGEELVLAEQTSSKRFDYGPVEALSAKEFAELVGQAVRGELEPKQAVGRPEREPVAARARAGSSRGSGRVVFD